MEVFDQPCQHWVSASCASEKCRCGLPATHKIGEAIQADDPNQNRHNLTAYVCCLHFDEAFGFSEGHFKKEHLDAAKAYQAIMERGMADLRRTLLPEFPERYAMLIKPYLDACLAAMPQHQCKRHGMYRGDFCSTCEYDEQDSSGDGLD